MNLPKIKYYRISIAYLAVMAMLCLNISLQAQQENFPFDHLSLEQGLSQSTIQWILQDKNGFMWFTTQDGLNMYDGYTFTVYRHDPQDPTSLAGNFLNQMFEDHDGNIWVVMGIGGINKLDRATGKFTYYNNNVANKNILSGNIITTFHEDNTGNYWFGSTSGLDMLNKQTGQITHYQYLGADTNELKSNSITSVIEDHSGVLWFGTMNGIKRYDSRQSHFSRYSLGLSNPYITVLYDDSDVLWIGTRNGLNRFEKSTGKFSQYKNYKTEQNSLPGNFITSILKDRDNTLWVGTTEGISKLDAKTSKFIRYPSNASNPQTISGNNIRSITEDSFGCLWVVTSDGELNVLNKNTNTFTRIRHNPLNLLSISNNLVSSVIEDKSGTIWIGTQGGGINKFSRKKQKFNLYHNDPAEKNSLSSNLITAILEDNERILWIGTQDNGMNRFDRKSGAITQLKYNPANPGSISNNTINCLLEDSKKILWIGTQNGLNSYNKQTGGIKRLFLAQNTPLNSRGNIIRALLEDHTGLLWIGTETGLYNFNPETQKITTFVNDPSNPKSIRSNVIWSLTEDRDGVLWVGTAVGGLEKYNNQSGDFEHFLYDAENPQGLNNRTVDVIYEPMTKPGKINDILWIGTYSGGLNKFDKTKKTFSHYTQKEGLSNNRINGILEDSSGNLWLSTNYGISKFNPEKEQFRVYDYSDGLQSNEFILGAYCKTRDGEMLFGGINGMNSFYPEQIKDNDYIPPVVLTSFKKFDKPMSFDRASFDVKEISLSYLDNFFSIEFAALDFTAPQKNQYAYKLEGFDPDWVESGSRRYASYTNLDPGTYVFQFMGSNNDGVWNKTGSSIIITITPPFFKTAWFRILSAFLILMFVYTTYKIRVRNIQSQKKKLENLVEERTGELQQKTMELQVARDELEVRVKERTSELRESNESLRKLKEFNENLVQTMAEGIVVQSEEGHITYVNPAAAKMFGYSEEELIGKHWSSFVPSNLRHIVLAADQRRKEGISDHYEIQLIKRDGSRIFQLVGGTPLYEKGKFSGTIAVFTDITERKRAEEQIKDQAALIESAHDAIIVSDLEGNIIYWNHGAEIVYGWKRPEILGKNAGEILYLENPQEHVEALRVVLEKNEWSGELHHITKDEKGVIVDSRWTLLHDHEGFPKSILLINTDITERVKLQMQFLRTQRLESLGTLASGIAHDLNNVLAPILMAVQILKKKFTDENSHRLLDTLETTAKRGSGIVKQVLTFARGAEGKKEELLAKHMFKEIENIILETFPKSITLKVQLSEPVWPVFGDSTHLHQILLNLCVNARDAMPDGGILTITAENVTIDKSYIHIHPQGKIGPYVVFSISDTGMGIPKEVMDKIFEPFFTTKGIGKGTGLGLSTVSGIVKEHGGFVNVYSEPGKGTSFKIYLPAGANAEVRTSDPKKIVLPSGNGETILVVDDEIAIRQITKGTLETYGYKVLTAENGIEAEDIFRANQNIIKLVLTDMMMPGRDGSATITVLSALNPDIRIIVMSGLVSHENVDIEIGKTIRAFLPKPYTAEKLLRTIHEVITS